jgi:hypothetical protein
MSLHYIKLNDIFKTNIYDIDSFISENNTILKTHAIKYYSNTNNLKKNTNKKDCINILLSSKNDFLSIKSKINELSNIDFYIYVDDENKFFKYYDSINNIFIKTSYFSKLSILSYVIKKIYINCELSTSNNNFILPIGLLNRVKFRLKFNINYFLLSYPNTEMRMKMKHNDKIILDVQTTLVKLRKQKKKELFKKFKYEFKHFKNFFDTLINLDNIYLHDSWFITKYINILKSSFIINNPLISSISNLTNIIKINALEKKSSNIIYKNYKLFIKNNHYYNLFVTDLYKFKSLCKNLQNYKKNISIKDYESYPTEKLIKINDFYTSKISYSNFIESLEEGTIFGTLINGNFKRSCTEGLEPHIFIKNLNSCIITYEDFIENSKYYYDKYNLFDNGFRMKSMINYDGIGKGNIFIPLYISKNHYELIKKYTQIVTGINIYNNPIRYNKKNLLIYVNILTKFIYNTFCKKQYNSDKWYNILINYIIFVNNIIFDNFTKVELLDLFNSNLIKIKFNKNFVIGLYIILKLNNIITDNKITIKEISKKILEEEIRLLCSKKITNINEIINKCTKLSLNNYFNFLENELDIEHITNVEFNNQFFKDHNNIHLDFVKTIYSFNKFIDIFENKYEEIIYDINENHGILSNNNLKYLKDKINENIFIDENDEISGFVNPLFDGHLIMNKSIIINIQKVFSKLNITITDKQLYAMLIQGILQRNFNKRKLAIKNKYYIHPLNHTDECILNCLKILIKIWYSGRENNFRSQLIRIFSTTKKINTICGIIYLVEKTLPRFIINAIENDQTTNIKLKLDILSKNKFIPNKYAWLLPKEEFHLALIKNN